MRWDARSTPTWRRAAPPPTLMVPKTLMPLLSALYRACRRQRWACCHGSSEEPYEEGTASVAPAFTSFRPPARSHAGVACFTLTLRASPRPNAPSARGRCRLCGCCSPRSPAAVSRCSRGSGAAPTGRWIGPRRHLQQRRRRGLEMRCCFLPIDFTAFKPLVEQSHASRSLAIASRSIATSGIVGSRGDEPAFRVGVCGLSDGPAPRGGSTTRAGSTRPQV